MEDLKRLVFPAIAAIVLHGFLVSFQLPKRQITKPVLQGNSIKIEINTFIPKTTVPKKQKEVQKTEAKPKVVPQKKVVEVKAIKQPVDIPKQQKKVIIKPKQTKKKVVVEEKKQKLDLQKRHIERKVIDDIVTPPFTSIETLENKNVEDLPEKKTSPAPIQKKAIPIYRQNKQPPYPLMARRRGYEGEVLLSVLVDSRGRVSEIIVKSPSGHLRLDRAAVKAVQNWLFTPALEGGMPVPMWVDVPIDFQLK